MIQDAFSPILLAVLGAVALLCLWRPFVGLLLLVGLTPFYTLLREASAGTAVFFIWPYVLTGLLMMVVGFREASALLRERGFARPEFAVVVTTVVALIVVLSGVEIAAGAVSAIVTDRSLTSLREVIAGRTFDVVVVGGSVFLAAFLALFLRGMRRREGLSRLLDLVVAMFLLYGLLQILNTWIRTEILFVGLNGFRYYFIGACAYFPARYFITDVRHRHMFVMVLMAACTVGAIEILLESYLLNVRQMAPAELPWSGRLLTEFDYQPGRDRPNFDGYHPMGFMNMAHMSGLFLLLGLAVCVPRAMVARHWRAALPYAVAGALLVTGAVWTSRTVAILMVMTALAGVMLVPASWLRRFGGVAAVMAVMVVASDRLIPGARYDLRAEVEATAGRTVPALLGAVGTDLQHVVRGRERLRGSAYSGWSLTSESGAVWASREHVRDGAASVVVEGEQGASFRHALQLPPDFAGRTIVVEAWMKAFAGTFATLLVQSGGAVGRSQGVPPTGEWTLMTATIDVPAENGVATVEIDVSVGRVYVDHVRMRLADSEAAEKSLVLLGEFERPSLITPADDVAQPPVVIAETPASPDIDPVAPPLPTTSPGPSAVPSSASSSTERPARIRARAAPATLPDDRISLYALVLFGRGAQYSDWNSVLVGAPTDATFLVASYSDTKYLEFAEQFGLVGLLLLVVLAGMGIWHGARATLAETDPHGRAELAALALMVAITFISLMHLPSLFRVGYNTAVFVALAILAGSRRPARARTADKWRDLRRTPQEI
jgi:hypothetical protein